MDPNDPPAPRDPAPRPVVLGRDRHDISRKNIDPDCLKVLYRLHNHGFISYLVGGAVRDMLLGRVPQDFDVATDAHPGRIKRLFVNSFLIGRRFRLVHVRFRGNKTIEVSTFRRDPGAAPESEELPSCDLPPEEAAAMAERGGAPAEAEAGPGPGEAPGPDEGGEAGDEDEASGRAVARDDNTFGTPAEDAFRRDLTINALFYDIATFSIIDYVGGLRDLEDRLVRIIGEPAVRYAEDPVRIWRVLRHAGRLDFRLEEETARAIATHRGLLAGCSGFRLYEEFNKDLEFGGVGSLLSLMRRYGVLAEVFGKPGRLYQESDEAFEEVQRLADRLDRSVADAIPLSRAVAYGLLLYPWLEREVGSGRGDRLQQLHDAVSGAEMAVFLPKALRADIVQMMYIVDQMNRALETGRMRWSLRRKGHYANASRLLGLALGRNVGEEKDPFDRLFAERFAGAPSGKKKKKRRRRGKGQGASGAGPGSGPEPGSAPESPAEG